jgi:hypothetical protein
LDKKIETTIYQIIYKLKK